MRTILSFLVIALAAGLQFTASASMAAGKPIHILTCPEMGKLVIVQRLGDGEALLILSAQPGHGRVESANVIAIHGQESVEDVFFFQSPEGFFRVTQNSILSVDSSAQNEADCERVDDGLLVEHIFAVLEATQTLPAYVEAFNKLELSLVEAEILGLSAMAQAEGLRARVVELELINLASMAEAEGLRARVVELEAALKEAESVLENPTRLVHAPPLTFGEKEMLRVALSACWNPGSISSQVALAAVVVRFSMSRDGTPDASTIQMLSASGEDDTASRTLFEAAGRAIRRCGAKGFSLPSAKYEHWQEIEIVFRASGPAIQ